MVDVFGRDGPEKLRILKRWVVEVQLLKHVVGFFRSDQSRLVWVSTGRDVEILDTTRCAVCVCVGGVQHRLLWSVSLSSCDQGLKVERNKLLWTVCICIIIVVIDIIMAIQHMKIKIKSTRTKNKLILYVLSPKSTLNIGSQQGCIQISSASATYGCSLLTASCWEGCNSLLYTTPGAGNSGVSCLFVYYKNIGNKIRIFYYLNMLF